MPAAEQPDQPPYSRGYFASRLRQRLDELREARSVGRERFAEMIGRSPALLDDWCNRRSLPEKPEDLQALAVGIASALGTEMTSILAELRHEICLDILDHTLRERLQVSPDTAADLLDELRLRA